MEEQKLFHRLVGVLGNALLRLRGAETKQHNTHSQYGHLSHVSGPFRLFSDCRQQIGFTTVHS
jgi:hypothetical protein